MGSIALTAIFLLIVLIGYVVWYFGWEARNTAGMAYYGRSVAGRQSLKRRIGLLSLPVAPILRALAAAGRSKLTMPVFDYDGVSGPPKVSSPQVFARARDYRPRSEDVFVATQMRCGTTWMQQLVYQVVTHGEGEFVDPARSHLYAISPWIEAVNSVSMEDAPLVGSRPTRLIKTHLPASHCPYDPGAKYIYVARHPVSCFASIVDFNRSMLGPLMPPVETMAAWFCSEQMYWRPWPAHVTGWWEQASTRDNVLFVHFEDMKRDLQGIVARVAVFLGVELTAAEKQRVVDRCSFAFMKDHEEFFEMAPPTMFSVAGGGFLASGKEARHEDVTAGVRDRILDYCRRALAGSSYPAGRFYPELGTPAAEPGRP